MKLSSLPLPLRLLIVLVMLGLPVVALTAAGVMIVHDALTFETEEATGDFDAADAMYPYRRLNRSLATGFSFTLSGDSEGTYYRLSLLIFPRPLHATLNNSDEVTVVYKTEPQLVRDWIRERNAEAAHAAARSLNLRGEEDEDYEEEPEEFFRSYYTVAGITVDGRTYFGPLYYRILYTFYGLAVMAVGLALPVGLAVHHVIGKSRKAAQRRWVP